MKRLKLGGFGQPWQTLRKLFRLLFLSQLLSPFVALLSISISSSVSSLTTQSGMESITASSPVSPSTTSTPVILPPVHSCCVDNSTIQPCPNDHNPSPSSPECQNPSTPCSSLPLTCLKCNCPYSCKYGAQSNATCNVAPGVLCQGERNFSKEFTCSYCFLTDEKGHSCSTRDLGCRSVGSPTSRSHWYIANCTTAKSGTICLGKQVFSKRRECNWTEGYSWKTACILSITLGGFGADRFYLGHWQEGIGKLFSFGGLGVWTLVDVVLVSVGYIGPADGSLYMYDLFF